MSEWSPWPPGEEAGAWGASEGPLLLHSRAAESQPWASRPALQRALSSKALWRPLNQLQQTPLTLTRRLARHLRQDYKSRESETWKGGWLVGGSLLRPALTPGPWTDPVKK